MGKDYIREGISIMRGLLQEDVREDMESVASMTADEKQPSDTQSIERGDDIPDSEPEEKKESMETIPYTTNDELLSSITQTCKERFGANFTKSKTPMLYYPKDGDITLTGEISSLNNAVFQFRYKDSTGNGCYVWLEPIHISDETLKTLNIINGVYKNWKNELATSEDVKPMSLRNEGVLGGQPGDDLD